MNGLEKGLAVTVVRSAKARIFLYQPVPLFRSVKRILEFGSDLFKGVLELGFPISQNGFFSGLTDGLDLDRQLCVWCGAHVAGYSLEALGGLMHLGQVVGVSIACSVWVTHGRPSSTISEYKRPATNFFEFPPRDG